MAPPQADALTGLRVLVCGGRDYDEPEHLRATLDALLRRRGPFAVLIHGAARGADAMAGDWAASRGIPVRAFPAQWDAFRNRRSAGPIRNRRMLAEGRPDLVVAFPGARGTAHMARLAREAGIEVIEVAAPSGPRGRTGLAPGTP